MKLDRTDRRILRAMQDNARISNLELAEAVGLSPTPCSRRVRRLEESGIIRGHVTLLDQAFGGATGLLVHFLIEEQKLSEKQKQEILKVLQEKKEK